MKCLKLSNKLKWGSRDLQKPLFKSLHFFYITQEQSLKVVCIIQTIANIVIDEVIFSALRVIVFTAGNKI